jgi:hypothetical protein
MLDVATKQMFHWETPPPSSGSWRQVILLISAFIHEMAAFKTQDCHVWKKVKSRASVETVWKWSNMRCQLQLGYKFW